MSNTILLVRSLSDILYHEKNQSKLQILGGGTSSEPMAETLLTVKAVPELCSIEKRERHIDFGPGVTISQMLSVGEGKMPSVLYEALSSIGNDGVKNLATLGGNICQNRFHHTLYAPLLALNARLEVRSQTETRYIPFSKFKEIPSKSILTKVRVPLDEWEIEIFRRVGPKMVISPLSASFVFLAMTQHGILTGIRIVYAGRILFTSAEFENKIIGTKLPISKKFIDELIDEANEIYLEDKERTANAPILKSQFLNLLRNSLERLL